MWTFSFLSMVVTVVPLLAYGVTSISLVTSGVFILVLLVFCHAALLCRVCLQKLKAGLYTKPCRRLSVRFARAYKLVAITLFVAIAGLIASNVGADIGRVSFIELTPVRLLYFAGFLLIVALACAINAAKAVSDQTAAR